MLPRYAIDLVAGVASAGIAGRPPGGIIQHSMHLGVNLPVVRRPSKLRRRRRLVLVECVAELVPGLVGLSFARVDLLRIASRWLGPTGLVPFACQPEFHTAKAKLGINSKQSPRHSRLPHTFRSLAGSLHRLIQVLVRLILLFLIMGRLTATTECTH